MLVSDRITISPPFISLTAGGQVSVRSLFGNAASFPIPEGEDYNSLYLNTPGSRVPLHLGPKNTKSGFLIVLRIVEHGHNGEAHTIFKCPTTFKLLNRLLKEARTFLPFLRLPIGTFAVTSAR